MKAIILAGGFGTRLKSVVSDLPKPLAPIGAKPFLAHLLGYLKLQGFSSIVLSLFYQHEKFQHYFGNAFEGLNFSYVIDPEPLGTGGAILHAMDACSIKESVFVLNGDTFVQLNYKKMYEQHCQENAKLSIALRQIEQTERYGKVRVEKKRIKQFNEKAEKGSGLINAGVYLMNPDLFKSFSLPRCFSIESDFFYPHVGEIQPLAFVANDYFIDIGIPDDYARAALELPSLIK